MAMIRRREERPPLSEPACRLVLAGDYAAHQGAPDDDFDDAFFDLVGVWRAHEPFLRAEAKRLNIQPQFGPGGTMFYAEAETEARL